VPCRLAAVVLTLPLVFGGSPGAPAVDRPPPPSVSSRCGVSIAGARSLWFRAADGTVLDGVTAGQPRTTVVFAHGYPSSLCDWADLAAGLVRMGYGVFLFDFRNLGLSDTAQAHAPGADLAAAVEQARRRGAEHVILVGGSYGATAVLSAAPDLDVSGVVALSPPPDLSNWIDELDAVSAVRRLHAPMLVLYAADDFRTPPDAEHALARAAASTDKRFVQFPGYWHAGALLYRAPFRARVKRLVLGFVRAHAEGR
jgi:pimeloyl-ACP methyl ester carboxylesterase